MQGKQEVELKQHKAFLLKERKRKMLKKVNVYNICIFSEYIKSICICMSVRNKTSSEIPWACFLFRSENNNFYVSDDEHTKSYCFILLLHPALMFFFYVKIQIGVSDFWNNWHSLNVDHKDTLNKMFLRTKYWHYRLFKVKKLKCCVCMLFVQ